MKKYLNSYEIATKVLENNQMFKNRVYKDVYEDSMQTQYFLSEEMNIKGLRYHDHYSSFFFTIDNRNEFLESVLYSKENMYNFETSFDELERIKKGYESLIFMDYDNTHYDELDIWLDSKAEELKDEYERLLKSFEDINEDDLYTYLLDMNRIYEDYYIIDNDYSRVYEDIPAHTNLIFGD